MYADGSLSHEIVQLDKIHDKHRHFIFYGINGQKTQEFYDKDKIIYDTLRKWTDEGKLYGVEVYNMKGYTSIDYWVETGKISDFGKYEIAKKVPNLEIYDSAAFVKYTVKPYSFEEIYYVRSGVWKHYHKNGTLASEGNYLPWPFIIITPRTKEDEDNPGIMYNGEDFLKDGIWNYYDEKGNLIKTETYKNGLLDKKK